MPLNQPLIPFPELKKIFRVTPLSLVNRIPGIYLVDKPAELTSHDIVAKARKSLRLKRVGHGGTLDPLATGLLLIMAGNATRLFDELQDFSKTYITTLRLGQRTDTQDITGKIIAEAEVPKISKEELERALDSFRGQILQTPPMYSALKKDGQPLYKLAREGKTVAREPRAVTVYSLECLRHEGEEIELAMTVSKGFYVRTLIDGLGLALGCGAVMTALRRTQIGPFAIDSALPVTELTPGPPPGPIL
ncbi:MAG: tRNA pseudouridine(55) synthase TruB [Planctomycetes bacterium]|nr:tRNA pseudouridine(55) synthase TruB [Planctomycetota bacterium]